MKKYIGEGNPTYHVAHCENIWRMTPEKEWTHRFIHTLEMIPNNWYLELEMHRDVADWDYMTQRFRVTFTFEHESPLVYVVL
jgi:hypothetical protein